MVLRKSSLEPMTGGEIWLESEGLGWEGSGRSCRDACEKKKGTRGPLLVQEGHRIPHLESDCFLDSLPQRTGIWGELIA